MEQEIEITRNPEGGYTLTLYGEAADLLEKESQERGISPQELFITLLTHYVEEKGD